MLTVAFYMLVGGKNYSELLALHPFQFWAIFFSLFGGLQLLAVAMHKKLELLQSIFALVNGSIWIWISAVEQQPTVFFVGISNLYAFSVGFLFLKRSWQNY